MKPWVSDYPAKFVGVAEYNAVIFDVYLGFHLILRQTISLELDDVETSKKVFLKRKLENMLSAATDISLRFLWSSVDDATPSVDIEIDHKDLIDELERAGYLS